VKRELSDAELRATILFKLVRRGCWSENVYFPYDTLVNWLGNKIKKDGNRVRDMIDCLAKDRYVLFYKKGNTIYLNLEKKERIVAFVGRFFKIWAKEGAS